MHTRWKHVYGHRRTQAATSTALILPVWLRVRLVMFSLVTSRLRHLPTFALSSLAKGRRTFARCSPSEREAKLTGRHVSSWLLAHEGLVRRRADCYNGGAVETARATGQQEPRPAAPRSRADHADPQQQGNTGERSSEHNQAADPRSSQGDTPRSEHSDDHQGDQADQTLRLRLRHTGSALVRTGTRPARARNAAEGGDEPDAGRGDSGRAGPPRARRTPTDRQGRSRVPPVGPPNPHGSGEDNQGSVGGGRNDPPAGVVRWFCQR